jgi:hypothetical protein
VAFDCATFSCDKSYFEFCDILIEKVWV